jgi:hypothetical protein
MIGVKLFLRLDLEGLRMIGEVVKQLKELETQKKDLLENLHRFFTNKEIPINTRWDVFLEVEKSLPVASSIDNFTFDMLNYEVGRGIFYYSWVEDVNNYDEWRELALATGTAGFEQDW